MHRHFVPAKVFRPRGNRAMHRPRLFARLDAQPHARIIWISGPPGAGKTTLVSSYLDERRLDGLWLQLDAGDADIATFFHYLSLAALQFVGSRKPELPLLTPHYLAGLAGFTRRYAEALSASIDGAAVIVIDNGELVSAQASLHEVIRELASSLAPGLRLIVMSRTEPPAAYARLRLNEDLVVLDGRELDLSRDEAIALATARAPDAVGAPDARWVDGLLHQTRGWFAGFVLLLADGAQTEAKNGNAETRQLLFDYFANELFARFEPTVQSALLRTALLPTMSVANAEFITGDSSIGTVLADLHRQNCFVAQRGGGGPGPGDGVWIAEYEYHALFRAFLLDRATTTIATAEWRALQCRVANLLLQSDQADAAAGLFRAAADWEGLATVILREAATLVSTGRHRLLQQWLGDLPSTVVRESPWLEYWSAAAWLPFDPALARSFLERAYARFEADDDANGRYAAWAGAMESFFFEWRDFRPADRWIAEFTRLHARHPEFSSRAVELRTYWAMGTLLHRQPQHPLLPAWSKRAMTLLDHSDRDLSVVLGGYLVIWFSWRGEVHHVRHIVERIAPWIEADMSPMSLILWHCAKGFIDSVSGRTDACRESIEAGLHLARRTGLHTFDFLLSAQMARCCLVAGDPLEAETWISSMAGAMRSDSHIDGAFYRHLQCVVAAQRGQWHLALDHGQDALDMALGAGVPFLEATSHLGLARALIGADTGRPLSSLAERHARHVIAARAIGRAMDSRVIEYLCLEVEAVAAFRNDEEQTGLDLLRRALAVSRAMDGATWRVCGPRTAGPLYDRALAAGIEVDHVKALIRRHRVPPHDPATMADAWPWPIRIYTLGRFEIVRDGEPLRSKGKPQHKPMELLGCLCAFGAEAVSQDRLTDALWPDADGDAADQAFRTTLHRLRKLLGADEVVLLENRHVYLDPRLTWIDCVAFDRIAHHPRLADRASLRLAMDRYRGPFLDGESASWAEACRERLHRHFIAMTERMGDLLEQAGDWPGARDCWLRGIEIEPLAEGFYRRLMQTLSRLGRRPEALAVYQRCRRAMLTRQGVCPTPETQALYRTLTDGLPLG